MSPTWKRPTPLVDLIRSGTVECIETEEPFEQPPVPFNEPVFVNGKTIYINVKDYNDIPDILGQELDPVRRDIRIKEEKRLEEFANNKRLRSQYKTISEDCMGDNYVLPSLEPTFSNHSLYLKLYRFVYPEKCFLNTQSKDKTSKRMVDLVKWLDDFMKVIDDNNRKFRE